MITGEVFSRQSEFAVMSNRPGIGLSWWLKYGTDTIRTDRVIMRGKALKPPRYYDKKFKEFLPIEFEEMQRLRVIKRYRLTGQSLPVRVTLKKYVRLRKAERARTLLQSAFTRSFEHV